MRAIGIVGNVFLVLAGLVSGCNTTGSVGFDATALGQHVMKRDSELQDSFSHGDLAGAANLISDRYVYNDIAANRITKEQLLTRRNDDKRKVVQEIEVDSEVVVLSESVVLLRGRTDTVAHYYGGLPRRGGGRYLSLWNKESDGVWRVVAEQATEATQRNYPVKTRIAASDERLTRFAGEYLLETDPVLKFVLQVKDGTLLATIPDQFKDMVFYPEGELAFFSTSRPFELQFDPSSNGLTLTTWGTPVAGKLVASVEKP